MQGQSKSQPLRLKSLEGRQPALLVLADGTTFSGFAIGASGRAVGEVVFNTGMSGYQEVLTDPSYHGQVVTFTSPHIGNYGVNDDDGESTRIHAVGTIIRDLARRPSNHRSRIGFEEWLIEQNVVGICEIDTRSLTRHLREQGVVMGVIAHGVGPEDADEVLSELAEHPSYEQIDHVEKVASTSPVRVTSATGEPWKGALEMAPVDESESVDGLHVVVIDFGVKFNILRHLLDRDITVTLVPRSVDDDTLEALAPTGVLFSNGPGDPARMKPLLERVRSISLRYPTMGICLGHQLLASAFGGTTYKLPYGHRGPNQPVLDCQDRSVAITSQNHGYSVERESFPECLQITSVNLNDDTVAGFSHRDHPIIAVQYHPEAGPGPRDAAEFFDEFVNSMRVNT